MNKADIFKLCEEIKLRRFKTKRTQVDCANLLGISRPTYRELEMNPNKITLEQAIMLGSYLRFDLLKFLIENILQYQANDG